MGSRRRRRLQSLESESLVMSTVSVIEREREREQKSSLNESHMSTISSKTSISLKVFGDSKCLLEKFPGGEILSCRSNHFE